MASVLASTVYRRRVHCSMNRLSIVEGGGGFTNWCRASITSRANSQLRVTPVWPLSLFICLLLVLSCSVVCTNAVPFAQRLSISIELYYTNLYVELARWGIDSRNKEIYENRWRIDDKLLAKILDFPRCVTRFLFDKRVIYFWSVVPSTMSTFWHLT